jgi:hypothetical protein
VCSRRTKIWYQVVCRRRAYTICVLTQLDRQIWAMTFDWYPGTLNYRKNFPHVSRHVHNPKLIPKSVNPNTSVDSTPPTPLMFFTNWQKTCISQATSRNLFLNVINRHQPALFMDPSLSAGSLRNPTYLSQRSLFYF